MAPRKTATRATKPKYFNKGKPWTEADSNELLVLRDPNNATPYKVLERRFGRTEQALRLQLFKLNGANKASKVTTRSQTSSKARQAARTSPKTAQRVDSAEPTVETRPPIILKLNFALARTLRPCPTLKLDFRVVRHHYYPKLNLTRGLRFLAQQAAAAAAASAAPAAPAAQPVVKIEEAAETLLDSFQDPATDSD
ncbi:hypothetical protein CLAFUR4_03825 [Fulvia fulva]|nr:hypothetical protein CLAFUR4_03825 [Fulvia fulva]WPV26051.1 hypothetical protein CLAFUW7_03829 [Fulvia fulva]